MITLDSQPFFLSFNPLKSYRMEKLYPVGGNNEGYERNNGVYKGNNGEYERKKWERKEERKDVGWKRK